MILTEEGQENLSQAGEEIVDVLNKYNLPAIVAYGLLETVKIDLFIQVEKAKNAERLNDVIDMMQSQQATKQ